MQTGRTVVVLLMNTHSARPLAKPRLNGVSMHTGRAGSLKVTSKRLLQKDLITYASRLDIGLFKPILETRTYQDNWSFWTRQLYGQEMLD